jgi:hypothetical protein
MLRKIIFTAGVFALFTSVEASAQIVNLVDGVNKAGRQRMLSQRCAKAYLALTLVQDRTRAQSIMDECVAMFSRTQLELKAFAPTPEIKESVGKVDENWAAFTAVIVGKTPDKSQLATVLAIDAKLLESADKVTALLQQQSATPGARIVNVSGRQRMLAQRIAKFQIASFIKNEPAFAAEVQTARKEYQAAKTELLASPITTATIKNQLDLAVMQWDFFENALTKRDAAGSNFETVRELLSASENVSLVFDNLTRLYASVPQNVGATR